MHTNRLPYTAGRQKQKDKAKYIKTPVYYQVKWLNVRHKIKTYQQSIDGFRGNNAQVISTKAQVAPINKNVANSNWGSSNMHATPTCNSYISKITKGTDIYSNKRASEGCSDGSYYLY